MTLEEIGAKYGTDKGTVHSYLPVYEELLGAVREEPLSLLEIGVAEGRSLAMWLEWLPNAMVHGLDRALPDIAHPRLRLFEGDQSDESHLYRFRDLRFDVIVDDGSHEVIDQLLTCHALWQCLKPGGWYFVEDVLIDRVHYWSMLPGARVWKFLKNGRPDDVLILARKS